MDREELLNALVEVQYELAKVKMKLDDLISKSIPCKEVYPELDKPVCFLQSINDEIYETIEIEKWVVLHSLN